jgi:predicted Fe-S protein YdhL (DUF1289 family)
MMNRNCKRYLRQIRRWLPCTPGKKQSILGRIRENIMQYLQENADPTFQDLQERFGDPQQIAAACVDEMGSMELLRDLRICRRIVTVVVAAAMAAVLIWAAAVTIMSIDAHDSVNGFYTDDIEEID